MTIRLNRFFLFVFVFITLIVSSGMATYLFVLSPSEVSASIEKVDDNSPTPTLTNVSNFSNATPTPFQPIPPTPIVMVEDLPTATLEVQPSPTPQPEINESEEQALEQLSGQVNVLLLGADARPWSSNFRTDTIMLLTINPELGRVNITSFPRDLYVTVPGWGMQRINSAWPYGRWKLLQQTFEHNFGVHVDYYAVLKFSSFKQIVDSLGGLDILVGKTLSDYRAGYWVTIPAGEVHMDADDVLWYVRSRKTTNDFERNRRQQEVLQAIFKKLISMNGLRRVPELHEHYKDGFITNIELLDLLAWLPVAARVAENPDNINYYAVKSGMTQSYITPYGAMVLLPDRYKVMKLVRKSQNIE